MSDPSQARVSGADRARDAASLALLLGGGALFAWSSAGMRALAGRQLSPQPGHLLIERYAHYEHVLLWGIGSAAAGIALGVWSHLRYRRRPSDAGVAAPASSGAGPTGRA